MCAHEHDLSFSPIASEPHSDSTSPIHDPLLRHVDLPTSVHPFERTRSPYWSASAVPATTSPPTTRFSCRRVACSARTCCWFSTCTNKNKQHHQECGLFMQSNAMQRSLASEVGRTTPLVGTPTPPCRASRESLNVWWISYEPSQPANSRTWSTIHDDPRGPQLTLAAAWRAPFAGPRARAGAGRKRRTRQPPGRRAMSRTGPRTRAGGLWWRCSGCEHA